MNADAPLALYIHWPFCKAKCPYCDFNSHVADSISHDAWRTAYRQELQSAAQETGGRRLTSLFFGGGTPSLMEPETVATILETAARYWSFADDIEITLEANPTSVEAEKFKGFRAAGVNRLSLGVQALNDADLAALGRAHSAHEARAAIDLAAKYFDRFSFDLIYARRDQTPAAWEKELREALTCAATHLSLYQLTIEPNTVFHTRTRKGERLTAPEDTAVILYEMTQAIMESAGLPAYEISNHARAGHESRHNLTYWQYKDYLGIGPGAHGRLKKDGMVCARENIRAPEPWLNAVRTQGHGLSLATALTPVDAQNEAVLMGLRLRDGIAHATWREKFGTCLVGGFLSAAKVARMKEENYLLDTGVALMATPEGRQRLNAVLGYLLG